MSAGTESWKAQETTDLVGSNRKITVIGRVQTSNSSQDPKLIEAVPPGPNPTNLLLNLKISGGIGGTVVGERAITFEKPVEIHRYDQVTIRPEDGEQVRIAVEFVPS